MFQVIICGAARDAAVAQRVGPSPRERTTFVPLPPRWRAEIAADLGWNDRGDAL